MPLPVLEILPQAAGYSVAHGNTVVAVELDGGAPRYRSDKLGKTAKINVTWILAPAAYSYFMAFFRTAIANGALPFEIDLIIDSAAVATYTARFEPGSLRLSSQEGLMYQVDATLDATPAAVNTSADETLIALGPDGV